MYLPGDSVLPPQIPRFLQTAHDRLGKHEVLEPKHLSAGRVATLRERRVSWPRWAPAVTILSQKGGTGGARLLRTLADVYRRAGLDVLCVDLDPQGNLSDYFDVPPDASPTVADVLAGQAKAADAVHDDILPANLGLAEAELILGGKMDEADPEAGAARPEAPLRPDPGGLPHHRSGSWRVNALVAANDALISSEAEYFSLQGVEGKALEVVELAEESLHPDLGWLGMVLNIVDLRLVSPAEALKQLKERFGDKVFDAVVRRSVRYAESSERGVSIVDYAPDLGADSPRWRTRCSPAWAASRRPLSAWVPCAPSSCRPSGWPLSELMFAPVSELARMVRDGEITSRELVEASLERIEALQPELNAFVHVDARALAAADASRVQQPPAIRRGADRDQGHRPGRQDALHDGSRPVGDSVPGHDAFLVQQLRDAGSSTWARPTLPSSGSCPSPSRAASARPATLGHHATAAGPQVEPRRSPREWSPIAHGSDGGVAPIRVPAACCGLVGLKPPAKVSRGPDQERTCWSRTACSRARSPDGRPAGRDRRLRSGDAAWHAGRAVRGQRPARPRRLRIAGDHRHADRGRL